MHNIAIAAAGTGGHIFPGIAIADELRKQLIDANIIFVGSKEGIENEIIPKHGYECLQTTVRKLHRFLTLKNMLFPFTTIKGILETKSLFKEHRIMSLIGCGGFVTGTAGYAAKLCGIPIFLQEQNSYPGLSTRLIAKFAKKIYLGNDYAKNYLEKYDQKCIYTGNPVRKYEPIPAQEARKNLGLQDKFTLFVYGGSQGSKAINDVVVETITQLLEEDIQIIFQTGERLYNEIRQKCPSDNALIIRPFIDRMDEVYSACDLVVCRAGAISLSEVAHFGIPAIIIPFPWAAGNHQLKNAISYQENNAAILLEEKELNPQKLLYHIREMKGSPSILKEMKKAMKSLAKPNATEDIVSDIVKNLGSTC